ncbi:MAG: hypothetical protein ACE5KM_04935 [Planctomycetaceae bacterium]
MITRKGLAAALLAVVAGSSLSGCNLLHEMQPHRLKKLNNGINGTKPEDYQSRNETIPLDEPLYFASISDDVPENGSARRGGL